MKRVFSALIVLLLLVGMLPLSVSAATEVTDKEVIWFEDGSRVEIITEKSLARVPNTVTGSKTKNYYDANNNLDWTAKLTATFAYSGSYYTCTTANCVVTRYDTSWSVISNNTVRSSNTATTRLTMGLSSGGATYQYPYTIKLTCSSTGTLS